jgi:hypothetical protein
MAKSKKQQAAIAVSMKKQGKIPATKPKMQRGGQNPETSTFNNPKSLPEVPITAPKPNTLERIRGGVRKALREVKELTGKGIAVRAAEKAYPSQSKMKKGGTMKMKMGGAMKKK